MTKKRLQLSRKTIESGVAVMVKHFEVRLTLEGYYSIYNVKTKFLLQLSSYALMRRCLTDMLGGLK